jgi:hypothetical protein
MVSHLESQASLITKAQDGHLSQNIRMPTFTWQYAVLDLLNTINNFEKSPVSIEALSAKVKNITRPMSTILLNVKNHPFKGLGKILSNVSLERLNSDITNYLEKHEGQPVEAMNRLLSIGKSLNQYIQEKAPRNSKCYIGNVIYLQNLKSLPFLKKAKNIHRFLLRTYALMYRPKHLELFVFLDGELRSKASNYDPKKTELYLLSLSDQLSKLTHDKRKLTLQSLGGKDINLLEHPEVENLYNEFQTHTQLISKPYQKIYTKLILHRLQYFMWQIPREIDNKSSNERILLNEALQIDKKISAETEALAQGLQACILLEELKDLNIQAPAPEQDTGYILQLIDSIRASLFGELDR